MSAIILAYVPVIHRGYLNFFARHPQALALYLFGPELTPGADYLRKEIRALSTVEACVMLEFMRVCPEVEIAAPDMLREWHERRYYRIIMPDEDVCHELAETQLQGCEVVFDPVFLRWDRSNILRQEAIEADRAVPFAGVVAEMMSRAEAESRRASNWWRQVGAVIARDGRLLLAGHNRHLPSPQTPYFEGDPRNAARRGLHIELSTDFHAEAQLVAIAASRGLGLTGADLYVTTFPCPPCAKVVAASGIKRLFFLTGYAMVDGLRVIRQAGIEVIRVEKESPRS